MFKITKALFIVAILLLAMPVQAVQIASEGDANSAGLYDMSIDNSHMITFNGGLYAKYELKTTDDTLTIAESGTTYIMEAVPALPITITLPDADVGLEYTFTQGSVTGSGGGNKQFYLQPQSTDYIVYVNSEATNTFTAGDKIESQGYTGDSIKVICAKDLYWYTVNARGTFTDSN